MPDNKNKMDLEMVAAICGYIKVFNTFLGWQASKCSLFQLRHFWLVKVSFFHLFF